MKKTTLKKIGMFLLIFSIFITGCVESTERDDYDYNLSEIPGEGGIIHLIRLANSWTNDTLIVMFLLSLLIISFVSLKSVADVKRSMAAASFITMLVTFLIKMTDIAENNDVMDKIVITSIVLFVFCAIAIYFDREEVRF